jgi:hypothetical protein
MAGIDRPALLVSPTIHVCTSLDTLAVSINLSSFPGSINSPRSIRRLDQFMLAL